jgi:tetratricopeptide (TPR) repeat protein
LGWTHWYIAEKVDEQSPDISLLEWDDAELSRALEYFEKSLDLARKYGLKYELPGILHQTASVHWYLGKTRKDDALLEEARKLNDEAFEVSMSVRDIRYAIDSLVGYAEWDYDIGIYDNIPLIDQRLHSEFGQYEKQYELYFGRMYRIKADIGFHNQDWEQAFSNYAIGLAMIVDHHGFGRFTPERELLRLTGKLKQLNAELVKEWVAYLQNEWSALEKKQRIDLLLDWCSQYTIPGFSE